MLTPDDADLARRDPSLPGLTLLLDQEEFTSRLRTSPFTGDLSGAKTTYVRYKPGTSCLVAYRVAVDGSEVDVYAKAYEKGELAKIRKLHSRAGRSDPSRPLTAVWEDRAIVVSFFPSDSSIRSLDRLADAHARRRLFQKVFPTQPDFWDAAVKRVTYKPERRYVARLLADYGPDAALKCYTAVGYEAAKRGAEAFQSCGSTHLPRRLGKSNRHRMLAFEWLPGRLLSDLIVEGASSLECIAGVGVGLATLHAQQPSRLRRQTREMEVASLHAVVAGLVQLCPFLAGRVNHVANRLVRILADRPPGDRPIHGDFYASQVLIDSNSTSIIDFDEAVYADPLQDLGTFLAHLEHDAISGQLPPSRIPRIKESLLDGYRSVKGSSSPFDIELFTAIALLRLAPQPFREREKNWAVRTDEIIDRVEALVRLTNKSLSRIHKSAPQKVHVADPFHAVDDPQMQCLAHAIDPREVERRLDSHCPGLHAGAGTVRVRAIRVVRYKPRRRCLIEYDVEVEQATSPGRAFTLVGKVRAKGADAETYRLLTTLRNAGLNERSTHNVCIPEPVGIVPDFKMWLQRKVPGRPATELLPGMDGVNLAVRIAEAIHRLHQAGVIPARRHTMADELRILHERLSLVAAMKPEWSARLSRVLDACDSLGRSAPRPAVRGIHRDFYSDHVIVDGPRLWLVDFDLFCQGDSGLDVGNFQGHLVEQSLRRFGRPDALADRQAAMEARYLQLAGETAGLSARVYATLTLVRHIFLSTLFPERREFTEVLLENCEDRLAARQRPSVSRHRPVPK